MSDEEKHSDAFKDANRYAGKAVNMAERQLNELGIIRMRKEYATIFEAFIAGVEWARNQKE